MEARLTRIASALAASLSAILGAGPLPPARALETMTGRKVRLTTSVEPEILGGAVTKIGSKVYDGSLRTQLAQLRRKMTQE